MPQVRDSRVDVYYPWESAGPNLQIPREDIISFEVEKGYNFLESSGSMTIRAGVEGGTIDYLADAPGESLPAELDAGQRVELRAITEFNDASDTLDDDVARRLTAHIDEIEWSLVGEKIIEIECTLTNFIAAILTARTVAASYKDTRAVGEDGAAINQILERECPEVDRSNITGLSSAESQQTISANFKYDNVERALKQIGEQIGAAYSADGTKIGIDFVSNLSPNIFLPVEDIRLPLTVSKELDDHLNRIYATGGTGTSGDISFLPSDVSTTAGTKIDGNTTDEVIYETSSAPSSQSIPRVEIDGTPLKASSGSSGDVRVELAPAGGVVTSQNRYGSDSRSIDSMQSVNQSWSFDVDATDVDQKVTIRVSVPGAGSDPNAGFEIRGEDTDSDGNVENDNYFYKFFTAFPITDIANDKTAERVYRRRDARIKSSAVTQDANQELAQAKLQRKNTPPKYIEFEADGAIAQSLDPGDTFRIRDDTIRQQGDYIVVNVTQSYQANQFDTTIEAQEIQSL